MGLVLQYAENELRKYHALVNNNLVPRIELKIRDDFFEKKPDFNKDYDDAYKISVKNACGEIVGTNERSILLGVYKYLTLIGCFFYAPGKSGEIIPHKEQSDCCAEYIGVASNRHRGICIEGAVSFENVMDMIDFAPKLGFNSYFVQFREGHNFFERWYTHESNTYLTPEDYSVEDSRSYLGVIEREIKRRGLIYHKIGHGWTCECIGYSSTGWHTTEDALVSEETRGYLAEINGVRKFYQDKPLNTHLCYSNKITREKLVSEVVNYAENNRNVDLLHFWLADNYNNVCECEECRKTSVTDFYIKMLNEIDSALTKRHIDTKIVFLIYFELLWAPLKEKIQNPDRFILMFAPLTRTFSQSYIQDVSGFDKKNYNTLMEFKRNKMEFPKDTATNLSMLFEWQKHFDQDSFVFDYHFMWDIYRDFGGFDLSRVLYNDIRQLKLLGLNGFLSCQVNRSFFPSGFGMYVMGRTLFDSSVTFTCLQDEFFGSVFGKDKDIVVKFLSGLTQYFPLKYNRGEFGEYVGQKYVELFSQGKAFIAEYDDVIHDIYRKNLHTPSARAYNALVYCSEIYTKVADILIDKASGKDLELMKNHTKEFIDYISRIAICLQQDLDDFYFMMILTGIFSDEIVKM